MADNETTGSGKAVATRKVTYSGDANQNIQVVALAVLSGIDESMSVSDVGNGNPLPVTVINDINVLGITLPVTVRGASHDAAPEAPVTRGAKAVAHGVNPTVVTVGNNSHNYCNRAGIPFVIGGHPNVLTFRTQFTAAQTNAVLVAMGAGFRIILTSIAVTLDNASTVFPSIRIGFGTATTPTAAGVVLAHGGLPAGGGIARGDGSGILGIGADDEDLRITSVGVATGNGVEVFGSYYTIES